MIDVFVSSSSRPKLLPYCVESFKGLLFTKDKLNWILHEDFVYPKQSKLVLNYAKKHFDKIYHHDPCVGLKKSIFYVLPTLKSRYVVYLQDDWYLERPVDLDQIIWTMDQHPEINLIIFFKFRNKKTHELFPFKEYDFSGMKLCSYYGWALLPGVWRMSKFREHFHVNLGDRIESQLTQSFGTNEQRMDENYCFKNLGAYFYGPAGSPRYVKHLGDTWRMAYWRLEDGKPGGTIITSDLEQHENENKAPWVPSITYPDYHGEDL